MRRRQNGALYKLTFSDGRAYIGATTMGVRNRFRLHQHSSRYSNIQLYKTWRSLGEPTLKVLAFAESDQLYDMEIKAIAEHSTLWPNGYNRTSGGEAPSLETRAKMSAARKGKKLSPEICAKISAGWKRRRLGIKEIVPVLAAIREKEMAAIMGKIMEKEMLREAAGKAIVAKRKEEIRVALGQFSWKK